MSRVHALAVLMMLSISCLGQPGDQQTGARLVNGDTPQPGEIASHGGPVVHGTFNVYYIWYGNWSSNTAATLTTFAQTLGGSPYYNILSTYYDALGAVDNAVAFGGSTNVKYSHSKKLHDEDVFTIVTDAIDAAALPRDTNGVYFVLGARDVQETSGFCSAYCAWHNHDLYGPDDLKYSFVGNPDACPAVCEPQLGASPHDDPAADALAATIARQLAGTATNPDLNGWFDAHEQEAGDKCFGQYGTSYLLPNGSKANVNLAGHEYYLPELWLNASPGRCALSYP